ncbi:MAG: hypothetical protein A2Y79_08470 [Deltaproteobacteria bacterium RBG_13_43_22]|nr:MAG: hypothetical protein A2Y79_08470 [Deltaproteobacteria bacterium RBG_13_43_22]
MFSFVQGQSEWGQIFQMAFSSFPCLFFCRGPDYFPFFFSCLAFFFSLAVLAGFFFVSFLVSIDFAMSILQKSFVILRT